MERILAKAIVDQVRLAPNPLWKVTVWGLPPFDCERIYEIEAQSDNAAARDGITKFVEEMNSHYNE